MSLTPEKLDAIEAAASKATPGPWIAARMVGEDGNPLSPGEIGEYVTNSVKKSADESGSLDFLFIRCEKDDGPADVCHIGNGPTSPWNATLIALLDPQAVQSLVSAARRCAELEEEFKRFSPYIEEALRAIPGTDGVRQRLREVMSRIYQEPPHA